MSKLSNRPTGIGRWAILGYGAGLALLAFGAVVYFLPRPVPEGEVRRLCEREVRRQTSTIGTRVVEDFRQSGLAATFSLVPLPVGSGASTAVTCSVDGTAGRPEVTLQMQE